MTKEEYLKKIREIEAKAKYDKKALATAYALEHNTVKVGDFVSDGLEIIKVTDIRVYYYPPLSQYHPPIPQCIYEGEKYTKSMKPFKSGAYTEILQTSAANIK